MSWDDTLSAVRPGPPPGLMIGAGALVMLLAALVSLLGAGAGHGWMRPIAVTIFLFPIWPVAFWLPARKRVRPRLEIALGVVLLALVGWPAVHLLVDDFGQWTYSDYVHVAPPWFGIILIAAGTVAMLVWLWRRGLKSGLLPALLLGLGQLINLGLFWQALYGPGPWGFRGAWPNVLWFVLWASWQFMALWALLRAFDPEPSIEEDFA